MSEKLLRDVNNNWEEMYKYAKLYYEHHDDLDIPFKFKTNNGYDYDKNGDIFLGRWLENQRQKISPESDQGKLLTQMGMHWYNKNRTWEEMYGYAKSYYEYHDDLDIPTKFKTNNGYDYDENGKINLGRWIIVQRQNTLPESERGKLLNQIGMIWDVRQYEWKEMYEYARLYYYKHSNLDIPTKFKTNNGYDYDKNGKINLGIWIETQRQNTLPESERGKLLNQIGMIWDVRQYEWKEMYEYAKLYYEHHGDLNIPQKFKTNNGYDYDKNGLINLGRWLDTQRQKTFPESERGKLLTQMGMRWDIKENPTWEEMHGYAQSYYKYYGDLNIPTKFKTNNGYDYDENGKINLGIWIKNQRQNTSPESERGKLLSQIGMIWSSHNKLWEEMYKYAKIYYYEHSNLNIPTRFKTNNGYDYDKNGDIFLGKWIANNRLNTSPESERGKLLTQIGMIWSVKKNNDQIKTICNENNIDININKTIIKHISMQELISKIKYLNELNIPIVDNNGKLHEIFSMSNIDLLQKYGVSLENLVTKYYIPLEEKKVL